MVDFDLTQIRALDGDRQYGFEEFCAQLARRDDRAPEGARFVRLEGRGGDGGVECYWILADGTEWAWQAKLLDRLDKNQIGQSVDTALKVHPNLRRYTVCVPINVTGPTARVGRNQLDLWDEWVTEWRAAAEAQGMNVEFELWPASELLDRFLSSDPTTGRARFWFDTLRFGHDWFARQVEDAAKDAGPRYHPDLNVEVPIAQAFAAVGRTPGWREVRRRELRELDRAIEAVEHSLRDRGEEALAASNAQVRDALDATRSATTLLRELWNVGGNVSATQAALGSAADSLADARMTLRDELEAEHGSGAADNASFRQFHAEYMVAFPAAALDSVARLSELVSRARDQVGTAAERGAIDGMLLITGVAGSGKTHAVCDAAAQRLAQGLLSVVVLGQKLVEGDVWDQIRRIFGLPGDIGRDELLAALDAAGETTGHPILLFVDALNERTPREAWQAELAGLVEQVRRHAWIRLILTCRTIFVGSVVPSELELPQIEHRGFEGVEYEAVFAFFTHFGLEAPAVPLLQPEYANPLFLRLACLGLTAGRRQSLGNQPPSLREVIDLMIESTETRAADSLDVDVRERLVRRAVDLVVGEMRERGELRLPWQRAHELIDGLLPSRPRSQSLLQSLLSEGILTEVQSAGPDTPDQVTFGFERLGEFLVTSSVLGSMSATELTGLFGADGPLRFDSDPANLQGLAEAAAILLPELHRQELPDVSTSLPEGLALRAFVASLSWRAPETFGRRADELVREALASAETFPLALDELLSLAPRAGHPMGASFFDELMLSLEANDRDAVMCPALHRNWERHASVFRLVEWATRPELGPVSEETAFDWARTIGWFCLAADRRIRDHATIGLVALGERRPGIVPRLLEQAIEVDDEYVSERLLLAAYGSLIRGQDGEALAAAAKAVWHWVFESETPTNALIRDHARMIEELALSRGLLPSEVQIAACRPPYGAVWPADWRRSADTAPAHRRGPDEAGESDGPSARSLNASIQGDDFAIYTMTSALRTYERSNLDLEAAKAWLLEEVERLGFRGDLYDSYDGYMLGKYGGGRGRPTWAERIGKKYQWIALYRLVGIVNDNMPVPSDAETLPDLPPLEAPGERNLDPTILIKQSADRSSTNWWAPVAMDFRPSGSDVEWMDDPTFPDSRQLIEVTDAVSGRRCVVLQLYASWNDRAGDDETRYPYRSGFMHIHSHVFSARSARTTWAWLRTQDFHGAWMPTGASWLPHVFAGEYPWGVQARRVLVTLDEVSWGREDMPPLAPAAHDLSLEFEFDSYRPETISFPVPNPLFLDQTALKWDGVGGYSQDGLSVFASPGVTAPGPTALVADRAWLEEFLASRSLSLAWSVLSEKQLITGGFGGHDLGYAVHSRAHRLNNQRLVSSAGVTRRIRRPE